MKPWSGNSSGPRLLRIAPHSNAQTMTRNMPRRFRVVSFNSIPTAIIFTLDSSRFENKLVAAQSLRRETLALPYGLASAHDLPAVIGCSALVIRPANSQKGRGATPAHRSFAQFCLLVPSFDR